MPVGLIMSVLIHSLWMHDDFADGIAAVQKLMCGACLFQGEVFANIRSDAAITDHIEALRRVRKSLFFFVVVDMKRK